jgi:hypothetical protein
MITFDMQKYIKFFNLQNKSTLLLSIYVIVDKLVTDW